MSVGVVVVSHSAKVAEGVVEMATLIASAIADADEGDGVLVVVDLGSAVLSAQLAIEELIDAARRDHVRIADAPLVEGAIIAAIQASTGSNLEEVDAAAHGAASMSKAQDQTG